jgi:hypothetical protein
MDEHDLDVDLELDELDGILSGAQLDAFSGHWHLKHRAVPALKRLAGQTGDRRFAEAGDAMAAAAEHFNSARDTLTGANELIAECKPADG